MDATLSLPIISGFTIYIFSVSLYGRLCFLPARFGRTLRAGIFLFGHSKNLLVNIYLRCLVQKSEIQLDTFTNFSIQIFPVFVNKHMSAAPELPKLYRMVALFKNASAIPPEAISAWGLTPS